MGGSLRKTDVDVIQMLKRTQILIILKDVLVYMEYHELLIMDT